MTKPGPKPKSIEERFWSKVVTNPGECWEWAGSKHRHGHGQIYIGAGTPAQYAHRVSWEIHKGPIPKGVVVRHSCDNPGCVNPDHLELGTQADNVRDMVERGRGLQYGRQCR